MITIRNANPKDIKTLQVLNQEVFINNAQYDSDIKLNWAINKPGLDYFKELLAKNKSTCFIAEIDNTPIGYIAVREKNIPYRKSRYLEIENLGVVHKFRSKGFGIKLVEHVEKWAYENGYQKIYVNSYINNKRAISFYKKCGFSEIDLSLEKKI